MRTDPPQGGKSRRDIVRRLLRQGHLEREHVMFAARNATEEDWRAVIDAAEIKAALPVFLEVTLPVRRERADCACPDFVEAALCVFLHLLMQAARGCTAHHAQASARATMPALRQRIAARGVVAKPSELSKPLLECSQRRRSPARFCATFVSV